jgi:MFS family permease
VQGFGAAALGVCSQALVNDYCLDPGERARAMVLWTTGGRRSWPFVAAAAPAAHAR